MSEVQYIWADPSSPNQQVALSSIVQGMLSARVMGIARWATKDGMDPKMGVVAPCSFDKVDCLLWVQVSMHERYDEFSSNDVLDAIRGRRSKVHFRLAREALQQTRRRSDESSVSSNRGTEGRHG